MSLNAASMKLILDFEVGGGEAYYNSQGLKSPIWPGAASGVTIGVGYDFGYNSADTIRSDWSALDGATVTRLCTVAGKTGQTAKAALSSVKDFVVSWPAALAVYEAVTIPKFVELTRNAFPAYDDLDPNCQGALVSLVFNRGASMKGDRRLEMRAIRDMVPQKDYAGIADQLRKMKRIWKGTDIEKGMNRRRDAEADLVLKSQP